MTSESFSAKYLTYKKMVFQISYSYLRNKEDAEDAAVDTFIKFYKTSKKFNSPTHERNFLIRVTINTAKDYLKRKRPLPLDEEVIGKRDESDIDTAYLWECVNNLKLAHKDIIYLRYILDLPYEEIASILKISAALARKRHQKAIEALRKVLGGDYE